MKAGKIIYKKRVKRFVLNKSGVYEVDKSRLTKSETKELRRLAGLTYERELAKALEALEENFR